MRGESRCVSDLVVHGEGRVVGGVEVLRGVQVQEVTEVVVHVDGCGKGHGGSYYFSFLPCITLCE